MNSTLTFALVILLDLTVALLLPTIRFNRVKLATHWRPYWASKYKRHIH